VLGTGSESTSAEGRLAKAKRYLAKLREIHPNIGEDLHTRREFVDLAEDCLVSLRSVPDHRLHEANESFGLGVEVSKPLFERTYRKNAVGNQPALTYLDWHVAEQKAIETTSTYGLPLDRRDLAVHRVDTRLNPNIVVYLGSSKPSRTYWGFPEIPYRDALDVLEELTTRMEKFVKDSDERLHPVGDASE